MSLYSTRRTPVPQDKPPHMPAIPRPHMCSTGPVGTTPGPPHPQSRRGVTSLTTPSLVNVSPIHHSPDLRQMEGPPTEATPFNVPRHVLPRSPLAPIGEYSQFTGFAPLYCEESGLARESGIFMRLVWNSACYYKVHIVAQIGTQLFIPNHFCLEPLARELPKLTQHSSTGDHCREGFSSLVQVVTATPSLAIGPHSNTFIPIPVDISRIQAYTHGSTTLQHTCKHIHMATHMAP